MWRMADRTAFAGSLMFEYIGTALRAVAAEAALVLRNQGGPTAEVSGAFMRRMTIGAAHAAFRHRMMARQIKLAADLVVTLEAYGFL